MLKRLALALGLVSALPSHAAITGISLVPVPVADQEQAKSFYVGTLGMALRTDVAMENGERWLTVGAPGQTVELTLVTRQNPHAPATQHVVLTTDDLDAENARLTALGVSFATPITAEAWGRFAIFTDPFGNQFILTQPN